MKGKKQRALIEFFLLKSLTIKSKFLSIPEETYLSKKFKIFFFEFLLIIYELNPKYLKLNKSNNMKSFLPIFFLIDKDIPFDLCFQFRYQ